MINEKALKQYILDQWRVLVQHVEDSYLIADGYLVARVDLDSEIFDNRKAFPHLPEPGQTLVYYGDGKRVEKIRNGLKREPELKELDLRQFIDLPDDREIFDFTPTKIYTDAFDPEAVVLRGYERVLLANRRHVEMFGSGVTFLSVSQTSPIIVKNSTRIIGCTMPMDMRHKETRVVFEAMREIAALAAE